VTFVMNDGTDRIHATVVVGGGRSILTSPEAQMPVAPSHDAGHIFVGWNMFPSGDGAWFSEDTIVLDNITVFARWAQHWYTVQFFDYDGTPISTMRVPEGGDAIAPPTPSRNGWIFRGWSRPYTNVTEDVTVWAVYRERSSEVVLPPVAPLTVIVPPAPPPPPPRVTVLPAPVTVEVPIDEPLPEIPIPEEPQTPEATAPEVVEDIEHPSVPLGDTEHFFFAPREEGVWALPNLILAALGALLAIGALTKSLLHKKRVESEEKPKPNSANQEKLNKSSEEKTFQRHRLEWLTATVVLGCAGVLIFPLTQDIGQAMVLMDRWTLTHAIVFILELIAFKLMHRRKEEVEAEAEAKIHQSSMVFK
jgi:hypothetical protein